MACKSECTVRVIHAPLNHFREYHGHHRRTFVKLDAYVDFVFPPRHVRECYSVSSIIEFINLEVKSTRHQNTFKFYY